jgi:DNA-directed RNA polymerase specialized sigma24 family protein
MLVQPTQSRSDGQRADIATRRGAILERVLRTAGARLRQVARLNSPSGYAEDALQDAFESFLRHFDPAVDPDSDYPVRWLTTTVKRAGWARARRASAHGARLIAPLTYVAGEAIDHTELVEDLNADTCEAILQREGYLEFRIHFAELKPDERRALSLLAVGLSYAEIQNLTGWSHTKVNRCLSEGRARLRQLRDDRDAARG